MTIDLVKYQADLVRFGRAEKTIRCYINEAKEFFDWFKKDWPEAKRTDIDSYVAYLQSIGNQESTICRKVRAVSAFYKAQEYAGLTTFNPVRGVKLPKIPERQVTPLTRKEVEAMLAFQPETYRERMDTLLVRIFYATGARRNDLATAKLRDYDPRTGVITVIGKGNKQGRLLLSRPAKHMLDLYLAEDRTGKSPLLLVDEAGAPWGYSRVYHSVVAMARRVGIKRKVWPHLLRHSIITHCYENGMGIMELRDFARHTSINTTQRYTHISTKRLSEDLEKYRRDEVAA